MHTALSTSQIDSLTCEMKTSHEQQTSHNGVAYLLKTLYSHVKVKRLLLWQQYNYEWFTSEYGEQYHSLFSRRKSFRHKVSLTVMG